MSPLNATNYITNTGVRYSEHLTYFPVWGMFARKFSNLRDIGWGQFCLVSHTCISFTAIHATLSYLVKIVFKTGSKEKMPWINTSGIVAFMKYVQSVWNKPISQFPRNTMCAFHRIVMPNLTVASSFEESSFPFPAFLGRTNINFFPKTFFNGSFQVAFPLSFHSRFPFLGTIIHLIDWDGRY